MKNRFLIYLFAIVLFTSCHTSKEILYFQDIAVNQPEAIVGARDITVQPKVRTSGPALKAPLMDGTHRPRVLGSQQSMVSVLTH